jgi:hypothetical protein
MKRILLLCSVVILFTVSASAQKEKPWTDWSEKDAIKVMTDSAWAQTQKELSDAGSPSGPAITTAAENRTSANMVMSDSQKSASESGESIGRKNASLTLNFYMAFLSAKPVRQAFIRYLELKSPEMPADKAAERRAFIDRDFGDYIVVTLKLDGTDKKKLGPAMQLLTGDPKAFKDTAYLERKDGKRVALMDYRVPDQLGAKFIFPRTLDGKPFLDANSGEVRVYVEIGKTKLSRRFKVADMMYDGKLEY